MKKLIVMMFLHICDDYYFQGILANLKQKNWWKPQEHYSDFYSKDYIVGLMVHSFSWSFSISLPFLVTGNTSYYIMLVFNTLIHAFIDDAKCNKFKLNLIQDQLLHLAQIIVTWFVLMRW